MKTEIEFNFAKWGQEGISILFGQFEVANIMESTTCGTFCVEYKCFDMSSKLEFITDFNLTMFQEVKPREFWLNLYSNGLIAILDSKEQAEDVGRSFVFVNPDKRVETIKVREVLD